MTDFASNLSWNLPSLGLSSSACINKEVESVTSAAGTEGGLWLIRNEPQ